MLLFSATSISESDVGQYGADVVAASRVIAQRSQIWLLGPKLAFMVVLGLAPATLVSFVVSPRARHEVKLTLQKVASRTGATLRQLLGALVNGDERARLDVRRAAQMRGSFKRLLAECETNLGVARYEVWSSAALIHDRKRLDALKELQSAMFSLEQGAAAAIGAQARILFRNDMRLANVDISVHVSLFLAHLMGFSSSWSLCSKTLFACVDVLENALLEDNEQFVSSSDG